MLGIGAGSLASDCELFGDIEPIRRGERMLEGDRDHPGHLAQRPA